MIQSLKIKNFLSFRDETTVSFEASNDKFAQEYQVVKMDDPPQTRLLRLGIIYGYNASGKSNILKAFDFLRWFWSHTPSSCDDEINVRPFKLYPYSTTESTCFELTFFVDITKYQYQLELNSSVVLKESLTYYNETEPIMLFKRSYEDGQSRLKIYDEEDNHVHPIILEKLSAECLKNMSFFVARDRVNVSLPWIDKAKRWMRNEFMQLITPSTDLTKEVQFLTYQDRTLKSHLLDFLHRADFNITGIYTFMNAVKASKEIAKVLVESDLVTERERKGLIDKGILPSPETIVLHTLESEEHPNQKSTYEVSIEDESKGTLRAIGIEAALRQALKKQAFIAIDEMENSLHPRLFEKMLFEYLSTRSQSQLLITTNNDGLLDLTNNLIRKDSIWFTEKDSTGASNFFKLTDFKGINGLPSIREAYRNNRFGATI